MFAVLKTGGKQYRVQAGDMLRVEKLAANAGEKVQFNEILMVGSTIGAPLVSGAAVQAEIIDQIKADKVLTYVKRRRKHSSQRTRGHRQQLTLLRITDILETGGDKSGIREAIGARTADAAYVNSAEKPAKGKKTSAKAKAEETAVSGAESVTPVRPENFLTEARNGGADDLKLISGVGPELEELLHKNGVFHFDQVASWGPGEIAYMDEQLSFHGRIEREEWVKQASKLARKIRKAKKLAAQEKNAG